MQDESTIFAVGFYPLLHMLIFPAFIFYLLEGARRLFAFMRDRTIFLRLYFVSTYAVTVAAFYYYFQFVQALDSCFDTFLVATFPFFMIFIVVGCLIPLLKVVNHFRPIWDSDERYLEIYLAVAFTVSFVSFVAFSIVVMNATFCA